MILPASHDISVMEANSEGNMFLPKGTGVWENYYSGLYAYEDLGYRTAVVVHDDFDWGETAITGFTRSLKKVVGK